MKYMCRINNLVSLRPLLAISIALIILFSLAPVSLAGPTKQLNPNLINKPGTLGSLGKVTNPGALGSGTPPVKMVNPNALSGIKSGVNPGKMVNPNVLGKIPTQNLVPVPNVPGTNMPVPNVPGTNVPVPNVPGYDIPGNYPGVTNINIGLSPGVVSAAPGSWYQSTNAPTVVGIVPFEGQCVLNERTGTFETAYGAPAWSDGKNMWVQSNG
jgi:hypothetical protein